MVVLLVLTLLFGVAGAGLLGLVDVPLLSRFTGQSAAAGEPIGVTIPEGASTSQIADILEEEGVVGSALLFRVQAVTSGRASSLKPGDYQLTGGMSTREVVEALSTGVSTYVGDITIPEGLTVEQIAERLAEQGPWEADEVQAALDDPSLTSEYRPEGKPLEGLLFPSTYAIDSETDPVGLLRRMLDQTAVVMDEQDLARAEELGMSPYEVLVVASIIEREARLQDEQGKVSRVIQNRLAADIPLQVDATVQYALGQPKEKLFEGDLEIDSPYNSYRNKGLPPTPIAAPGESAIQAALNPEDGPWLYYVLVSEDGAHAFTDDYDEFVNRKNQAKRDGVL